MSVINNQNILLEAFKRKNCYLFQFSIKKLQNNLLAENRHFNDLEIFSMILSTSNSGEFIKFCLQAGASFYKKTTDGKYPLQVAVDSRCLENVSTLLKISKPEKIDVKFDEIINMKFDGKNNFLHLLVEETSVDNFHNYCGLIDVLVKFGCCPHVKNDKNQTPMDLLDSCPITMGMKRNLYEILNVQEALQNAENENNDSFIRMLKLLDEDDEEEFLRTFSYFKTQSEDFTNEAAILLETAIVKNFSKSVQLMIDSGVDLNIVLAVSKYGKQPAFLAASLGRLEIFEILLGCPNLQFDSKTCKKNLLHEILCSENVEFENIEKMMLIATVDDRCTLEVINSEDESFKPPLYYACVRQYHSVSSLLLRRGAYVGSKCVVDVLDPDCMKDFLNSCLMRMKNDVVQDEILIDYQFLVPSKAEASKSEALKNISENSNLRFVLKHPVVSSFLNLKWNVVKWLFAVTSGVHFLALVFLVFTLSHFLRKSHDFSDFSQVLISGTFLFILTVIIMRETYEMMTSFKTYFFKLGNWLDLLTIGTVAFSVVWNIREIENIKVLNQNSSSEIEKKKQEFLVTLFPKLQISSAFLMLFVSAQGIKIFGWSIYTTMFKKVSLSFFKLILMYSLLFITFALSFHILYSADRQNEYVTDDLKNIVDKISLKFDRLPQNSLNVLKQAENISKSYERLIGFLENSTVTNEFAQENKNYSSQLKQSLNPSFYSSFGKKISEKYENKVFDSESFLKMLNYDDKRKTFKNEISEIHKRFQEFEDALLKANEKINGMMSSLMNSSVLEPGKTCQVGYIKLQRLLKAVGDVKKLKRINLVSLCNVSENTRNDFLENVLNMTNLQVFNPYKLCNASANNVKELVEITFKLKVSNHTNFKTFCQMSEKSRRELFKNVYNFDNLKIDQVEDFCQLENKTFKEVSRTFFNFTEVDFSKHEYLCDEVKNNQSIGLLNIKEAFNLTDSFDEKLKTICEYDEYFLEFIMHYYFFRDFLKHFHYVKLCFVEKSVRDELIENQFFTFEDATELLNNSTVDLILSTDKMCSSGLHEIHYSFHYFLTSFFEILFTGKLCDVTLIIQAEGLIHLHDVDNSTATQLYNLCKDHKNYTHDWMLFTSESSIRKFSMKNFCRLDDNSKNVLTNFKDFDPDGSLVHELCLNLNTLKELEEGEIEDILEAFWYFEDNEPISFHFCRLQASSREEILEKMYRMNPIEIDKEAQKCNYETSSSFLTQVKMMDIDDDEEFDDEYDDDFEEEISDDDTSLFTGSFVKNICIISSNSRLDLMETYGLGDYHVKVLDLLCSKGVENWIKIFELLKELRNKLYIKPIDACQMTGETKKFILENVYDFDEARIDILNELCKLNITAIADLSVKFDTWNYYNGLRFENICLLTNVSRSILLQEIHEWNTSDISKLDAICLTTASNFSQVFEEFSEISEETRISGHSDLCEISSAARKTFLESVQNLNKTNIELLEKFCESKGKSFAAKVEDVFSAEVLEALQSKNLCSLENDDKNKLLFRVFGKSSDFYILLIENLCASNSSFSDDLEHIVFSHTYSTRLQPKELCQISSESQNEVLKSFFNISDPKSIQFSKMCRVTNYTLDILLPEVFNLKKVYSLKANEWCLTNNESRVELLKELFKTSHSSDQVEKYCTIKPKNRKYLLDIISSPTLSIAQKFEPFCKNNETFWKNIAITFFDDKNCSFLSVEKVCHTEIIFDPDKLCRKDADYIKHLVSNLKKLISSTLNQAAKVATNYSEIGGELQEYEKGIQIFANFRTIEVSFFRTFAMFAGEFGSENFNEPLRMIMLLLFIFFVTITLQNLMNSIALIDAQQIVKEAEIIGVKKRISLVYSYEKALEVLFPSRFNIFSRTTMNRFILKPLEGRDLVLFEPSIADVSLKLSLSQDSYKNILKFFDSKSSQK